MPIIDTDTVKTLLQITDTDATRDAAIDDLIPKMQKWLIAYLNNRFLDLSVQMGSSDLTFTNATPATITDSSSKFVQDGDVVTYFYDGMDLDIKGTYRNDKIVQVATVTAGTLTLATGEPLVTEDAESQNNYVILTRVVFDEGMQPTIADMINWKLDKDRFCERFSIADYSETKLGKGGYPVELLKNLNPWKKMKWG